MSGARGWESKERGDSEGVGGWDLLESGQVAN